MSSPSNLGNISEAPAEMAKNKVPNKNHPRFLADIYRNKRMEFLNACIEILALGMSRSWLCGPAILQSSAFFANLVGVKR